MKKLFAVLAGLILVFGIAQTAPKYFSDFENPGKFKGNEFVTVEQVDGHTGKALKFTFKEKSASKFANSWVKRDPARDEYDGISFWIKGDGSKHFGGIQFIDQDDYAMRYGVIFPLNNTEWHEVQVAYRDIFPELPKGDILDPVNGYKPSQLASMWMGKWWYHREYPAHSFAIDDMTFIKGIELKDHTPEKAGIPKALAMLKARKPITIVAIGDSLTDARHWANRETCWVPILEKKLKTLYQYDAIKVVNAGIGGNQLNHGAVLMPRDMMPHDPDLVTICFGYNDWDSGMRGPRFKKIMDATVDRARRLSKGKSEVLLMTTCPAFTRWTEMKELAESVRQSARDQKTGLADIEKAFHAVPEPDRKALYIGKNGDTTHLGPPGDNLVAETVFQAIIKGAVPE
ncbi:GDSL-type esterase/lipase family protein [Planctomycetota bacterium]